MNKTWNPLTGCLNHIDGWCISKTSKEGGDFPCYAYRLANTRLKGVYLANSNLPTHDEPNHEAHHAEPFYPRLWEDRLWQFHKGDYDKAYPGRIAYFASREIEKGIFVCDMSDLFGIGIPEEWTRKVMTRIRDLSQHRFYLLTKQPQNLPQWSPFPDNCYVGVTATGNTRFHMAISELLKIKAKVTYLSIEPLLEPIYCGGMIGWIEWSGITKAIHRFIDWLIIGACTGTRKDMELVCKKYPGLTLMPFGNKWSAQPSPLWISEIINACEKAQIPYFLKDNLAPLLGDNLRQEMP